MNSEERQIFEAMQERIQQYEGLLEKAVKDARQIANIVSGPHQNEDGTKYYRVDVGGSHQRMVWAGKEKLEEGQEILVEAGLIVSILQDELRKPKSTKPFVHIGWDEVGGMKSQIDEIRRHIEGPIENRKLFEEYGIAPSKGALLYGPPGCGKTLISKVIASMIIDKQKGNEDAFVYIKGPELLSMYVGNTEHKIRDIFQNCREFTKKTGSKSVVFIDEADALLSKRGSGISSDVNKTIIPQFLSEMDGFDSDSPFVLLSTNLPSQLDPAVIREGRIDLKIEIKRPSKEDAVEIFGIHMKKVKVFDNKEELMKFGADHLYSKGVNVSGSMIKTIVNMAAQEAVYRNLNGDKKQKGVTIEDLKTSIEKTTTQNI